jgi:putative ATP-dependent endonuclease of the OLD family
MVRTWRFLDENSDNSQGLGTIQILKLTIKRYRGIGLLEWLPEKGMNCLIGPADSGKSTVLAAVALLFASRQVPICSDFDYFKRKTKEGFEIEAVLGDVKEGILGPVPILQGWKDRQLTPLPNEDGAEPVVVIRVVADENLDLRYEVVEYGGGTQPLSSGIRRQLPFARLTAWEYGSRELRLGYGSLLTKSIDAIELKAAIHGAAAEVTSSLSVPERIEKKLADLRIEFEKVGLPANLTLGLIAPPDSSLSAMFGLMIGDDPKEAIPLVYFGMGTRQNALFTLTSALTESPNPIIILDEPEIGLEPYRQRALIARLRLIAGSTGQAIIATHSSHVLHALESAEIWRLDRGRSPVSIGPEPVKSLKKRAPDALISALPLLAEGDTEAGFLEIVLGAKAREAGHPDEATLGIRIVRGKSHLQTLQEAQALLSLGFQVGVFVDHEMEHAGLRQSVQADLGCVFGTWPEGVRNIEVALAKWVPWEHLEGLISLASKLDDSRIESFHQKVNEKLGIPSQDDLVALRTRYSEGQIRQALGDAMDRGKWFKTLERARSLAEHLFRIGMPREMEAVLEDFWKRLKDKL